MVATRITIHHFPWTSLEAESIRTALRIGTALVYWWLLKPLILSRRPDLSSFRNPAIALALLLFLSIPILVGDYRLASNAAILFAITSLPVGIKEEFLFRGIMQNLLVQRYGSLQGVLITSLIFTLWHIGVWNPTVWTFSQIFFAGVILGMVYVRSGSILAVIILHTVYDAIFSFTPFAAIRLNENWGFIPLLSAVALVTFWTFGGRGCTAPLNK
jgi:membrane protease YdiL (CAAX protease family)